jgi:hypothetical protein
MDQESQRLANLNDDAGTTPTSDHRQIQDRSIHTISAPGKSGGVFDADPLMSALLH